MDHPNGATVIRSQIEYDKSDEPLYTPLDDMIPQVRLVKVHFRRADEAKETMIKCSMKTVSLHEVKNQYIALSYNWGNANERKPITINGHRYPVTLNLEAFLQEWRDSAFREQNSQEFDTLLWIDAICINQEDLLERNSQVNLMSKIYPSASDTLSWLGRGSHSCEYGLESIIKLAGQVKDFLEENDRVSYRKQEAWPIGFSLEDTNANGRFENFAWNGISDLFEVEYWNRAWVQQEVVLGKDIMLWYGEVVANLRHVHSILEWLNSIEGQDCPHFFNPFLWRKLTQRPYRGLLSMHFPLQRLRYLQQASEEHTLMESPPVVFNVLYHVLIAVRSTDPRDLLYSLLGVMDLEIQVDYEQTAEEVYFRFSKTWMTKPCGLIFLLGAGGPCPIPSHHSEPKHCSLPSWVPCWTSLKSGLTHIGIDLSMDANNGDDIRQATVKIEGRRLQTRGLIVSRVKWDKSINEENLETFLATYLHSPTKPNSTSRRLQLLLRFICNNEHPISKKPLNFASLSWIEVLDLLKSVALAFHKRFSHPLPDVIRWMGIQTHGDVAEGLLEVPVPPGTDPSEPTVKEDSPYDLFPFDAYLLLNLIEHTIFTTADGYIGWSLRDLRENDIVCILFGLKTPVILRKVDDTFRYIGPCTVSGLVDEDFQNADLNSTKIQTFDIY